MNSTSWIYPFIILGGVLQTCGAAMNAQLFHSLGNRWLASSVSFAVITAFFLCVFAMFPTPLPSAEGLANMPWWAVVGGLVGAVQVYAGLTLVNKVGAGTFVGLTVTAALTASLVGGNSSPPVSFQAVHNLSHGYVLSALCIATPSPAPPASSTASPARAP